MRYRGHLILLTSLVCGCLADTGPLDAVACQVDNDCPENNARCISGYCVFPGGRPIDACGHLTNCLATCGPDLGELQCNDFSDVSEGCTECIINTTCEVHCEATVVGAEWICTNPCADVGTADDCTTCITNCTRDNDQQRCQDEICNEVCQSTDQCTECLQNCMDSEFGNENVCPEQCSEFCGNE